MGKWSVNFSQGEINSQWPGYWPRSWNKPVSGKVAAQKLLAMNLLVSSALLVRQNTLGTVLILFLIKPGRLKNLPRVSVSSLNFMSRTQANNASEFKLSYKNRVWRPRL